MKKILLSSLLIANGVVASPFVIEDIRVNGALDNTEAAIISSLPVKIGQKATDADLTKIVQQLFVQQRFDDVVAKKQGNAIIINVVERPLIYDVQIEGNNSIPEKALQDKLKENLITKGEFFDAKKLEEIKTSLISHYHSIGRYNASVDIVTTPIENGQVVITLAIVENDVSYVKNIRIEGNLAFDDDLLIKKFDIQPDVSWWNIFESSKYEKQALDRDLATLNNFYLNEGYVKFRVLDVREKFSNNKKDVDLVYKVNEGKPYKVGKVELIGEMANLQGELQKIINEYKTGELFRAKELEALKAKLEKRLGDDGYASTSVNTAFSFDEDNSIVNVTYIVESGKRINVRRIEFEGNDVTADSTLRREMRQQEGTWLSSSAASTGKARLERTGFYESVDMKMQNVPGTTDQIDIIYTVKERSTGSINFGVGYGSGSGISYQASIKQDNFLGLGSSVGLSAVRNKYSTTFSLNYNEPYFTKDGVSLGGSVYYSDYDYSKLDTSSKYKRTTLGIDGTLGFPVDEYNSYYLGLGVVNDKIQNVSREYTREKYVASMDIKPETYIYSEEYKKIKTTDFNFNFGWNYNSLDRGFMPTDGLKASFGGEVKIPGSDNNYYKLNTKISYYYPLNREHKWVINARAKLGYASGIGSRELPFFQTYSAGGIGSVRGFSFGSIGPQAIYWDKNSQNRYTKFTKLSGDVIGGNAMAVANLELIMPTPFISEKYQHKVRTSLFFDMGSVWNTKWDKNAYSNVTDYSDPKRFRTSVGLGLQWNSPIGPLLFSYAKPLNKYKDNSEDDIEQFQFSIGGSF